MLIALQFLNINKQVKSVIELENNEDKNQGMMVTLAEI